MSLDSLAYHYMYGKPEQMTNSCLLNSPEKIKNNGLKKKLGSGKIREDLVEHYDYEKVTEEIWNHFNSWYGTDACIFRYIKTS